MPITGGSAGGGGELVSWPDKLLFTDFLNARYFVRRRFTFIAARQLVDNETACVVKAYFHYRCVALCGESIIHCVSKTRKKANIHKN